MHLPLDTFMARTPSPRDDPAVLNADDAVGELGDLLVVGDHHHGLGKFLSGVPAANTPMDAESWYAAVNRPKKMTFK